MVTSLLLSLRLRLSLTFLLLGHLIPESLTELGWESSSLQNFDVSQQREQSWWNEHLWGKPTCLPSRAKVPPSPTPASPVTYGGYTM